ncbi:MarR family winged helix-turn-helix transcriptional regulator [Aquimarina sp. W85]|uniref:MarR family winged helix-turn-helix transcriptional regulator n=1 Tax=Aquimarina rhodophyticola TaxID=3342246 RepID=UPI0036729061
MKFNTPTTTALYSIEEAIKTYRKFCQKNISNIIKDITVDQTLILIIIDKNPEYTQMEIAELVFKDYASITRIINLMISKEYLEKHINPNDHRRSSIKITKKGKEAIKKLTPVIEYNRKTALLDFDDNEIHQLYNSLQKIISNCKNQS